MGVGWPSRPGYTGNTVIDSAARRDVYQTSVSMLVLTVRPSRACFSRAMLASADRVGADRLLTTGRADTVQPVAQRLWRGRATVEAVTPRRVRAGTSP